VAICFDVSKFANIVLLLQKTIIGVFSQISDFDRNKDCFSCGRGVLSLLKDFLRCLLFKRFSDNCDLSPKVAEH